MHDHVVRRDVLAGVAALTAAGPALAQTTPAQPAPPDIVMLDALALSAAIRARRVSCRDVMQAYLTQIRRFNPAVVAIVSMRDDATLLREADERDAELARGQHRGWMHGFPHAVKDTALARGVPATFGSPIFRDNLPEEDSIFVERLRASGMILLGKTNVPEFAFGSNSYNSVFGTTGNAYDNAMTAGGSSGGAATSVMLRMQPVADGSDYFGSLRNPAGWANMVALRPSMGRVPFGPSAEVFWQQAAIEGPMGRTVAETAALLATMAGPDSRAPLSLADDPRVFAGSLDRDLRGLRVGWLGSLTEQYPFEPGVLDLCRGAVRAFETLGATVDEARLDVPRELIFDSFTTIRHWIFRGAYGPVMDVPGNRERMKPEAQFEIDRGRALTAAQLFDAAEHRSTVWQAVVKLQERFDILVMPTAQVFPFDKTIPWPRTVGGVEMDTYHRWMEVCALASLCGLPAAAVPAGFSAAGLPMGLQLIGRWRDDLGVLQAARGYEVATNFHRRLPPALRAG